jgi:hypothetical protein
MPKNEEFEKADDYWRSIIGTKIICSNCRNHNPKMFKFSVVEWGGWEVHITCSKCYHEGDYSPNDEETKAYENAVKVELEKQVKEKYGDNPPITNIQVKSVFRKERKRKFDREKWKDSMPPELLDEMNYALKA